MKAKFEQQAEEIRQTIANLQEEQTFVSNGITSADPYLQTFLKYKNIDHLERGIVVALIKQISIYEEKRIEVEFNFADQHQRILDFIEANQPKLRVVKSEASNWRLPPLDFFRRKVVYKRTRLWPHHSSLQPDRLHFPGLRRFQHAAHHGGHRLCIQYFRRSFLLCGPRHGDGGSGDCDSHGSGRERGSILVPDPEKRPALHYIGHRQLHGRDGLGRCGSGRKSL